MVYYFAINKNKIMTFEGKRMELDINILSKISQTQKDSITCFLSYVK
jgi:hypothetical protein